MRNYANTGYVLKAAELEALLNLPDVEPFRELLKTGSPDDIADFLGEKLAGRFATPEIFYVDEDCESDELETGVTYAVWSESDLYVKTETEEMKALKSALSLTPEPASWVTLS